MNWLDNLPSGPITKLLNPIADNLGQGVGAVFYYIFQKPIKFKAIHEAEVQDLAKKTASNLQKIPTGHRNASNRGLLLKTMEEARYQISEEELRTMFASLIASATDDRKASLVSPRFPIILSQLSKRDAQFFNFLAHQYRYAIPYVYVIEQKKNSRSPRSHYSSPYHNLSSRLYVFKNKIYKLPDITIDNLISLGLVTSNNNQILADKYSKQKYLFIKKNALHYLNRPISKNNYEISYGWGNVRLTALGKQFAKCVF